MEYRDDYIVWTLSCIILVLVSLASVNFISYSAAGSGIPELKAILKGLNLENVLTWRTFFAKCIGLTTILMSGLSTGKEGPFIHLSAIIG